MHIVAYEDPAAFRTVVEPFLLADEPRHHLMLGLVQTLVEQPATYPRFHLWRVREGGATLCAALVTPPYLLVLSAASRPEALQALATAIAASGPPLPGVVGALPEADGFAEAYVAGTSGRISYRMLQGIYALDAVADVPLPPGVPRASTPDDLDRIVSWLRAFEEETGEGAHWDDDELRRRVAARLAASGDAGYWLWHDREPVCLAGSVAPTSSGIRIGPVYTPPEHRRRGYATALVAGVSREMLARGHRRCFLYTDLANPTSNDIYQRIGYTLVCHAAMIRFEPVAHERSG